jgi:hypothetical protein
MTGGDWEGAAYMLGYVLECALKAAVCKTLCLNGYPSDRKKDIHFMTHNFDQLLVLSGMSSVFSGNGVLEEIQSWSEFTKEFLGDWPAMRYSLDHMQKFDEVKVRALHAHLTKKPNGILDVMTRRRKW